jgi:hypothetical protein
MIVTSRRTKVNESFADDLLAAIEGADMDATELAAIEDYFRRHRGRERLIEAAADAMNSQFGTYGMPAQECDYYP